MTALQTPETVTLAAVVTTVDGEMCTNDLEVAVGEIRLLNASEEEADFLDIGHWGAERICGA